jgi:hypothetical protein
VFCTPLLVSLQATESVFVQQNKKESGKTLVLSLLLTAQKNLMFKRVSVSSASHLLYDVHLA